MRRATTFALMAAALAGGAAYAAAKPNTPTPMPAVQAKMKAIVDKASTDLFNVAAEADPENGPDQKLPGAQGWATVKVEAGQLKAVADWMLQPKNGKTAESRWTASAKAMSDLSAAAGKAAAAHDAKALAKVANDLSDTCTACHSVYKPQS
jgi:hypothetical protein